MPVHDWTRVDAGIFHDFHNVWIVELRNTLNRGLLPAGYYAMSEQHAGKYIADVLTLQKAPKSQQPRPIQPGVAVADAPPKIRTKLSLSPAASSRRKTLTIRHSSGHRIVALLEIVSPANKDRRKHVVEFVNKVEDALRHGIHLLLVDLFPPGLHDPQGFHAAVWKRLGGKPRKLPTRLPLTLAAYVADATITAYVEQLAVGRALPGMPLFLDPDYYIETPLESTYQASWEVTPEYWREVVEPCPP
jgi:hypothetical protein